jgi:hypothetical protein
MNFGDATTLTTTSQPATTGGWLDKILGAGQKAADIYSTVKGSGSSQSTTLPSTINVNTPAPVAQDNTMKYVLIGGGVLLAVGIVYAVSKKKSK